MTTTFKKFLEAQRLTSAGIAAKSKSDKELEKMRPEELKSQLAFHRKESKRHYNGRNIQGGDYHRLEGDNVERYLK